MIGIEHYLVVSSILFAMNHRLAGTYNVAGDGLLPWSEVISMVGKRPAFLPAIGADLAYVGSAFIATREANATEAYKQAIVAGSAGDIVYTNLFTGVHGNYLRASIVAAGLDPDHLPTSDPSAMNFGGAAPAKAWKDIWGCGQGIGALHDIPTAGGFVDRLAREYD